MGNWFGRQRKKIALTAPLLFSLLSLCRLGYLSASGHVGKYWGDVAYFGIMSLAGSFVGSLPVMLWFSLTRRRPNSPELILAFCLSCGVSGMAVGALLMPSDYGLLGLFGLVNALVVGPVYCLIAGLPWRLREAPAAL